MGELWVAGGGVEHGLEHGSLLGGSDAGQEAAALCEPVFALWGELEGCGGDEHECSVGGGEVGGVGLEELVALHEHLHGGEVIHGEGLVAQMGGEGGEGAGLVGLELLVGVAVAVAEVEDAYVLRLDVAGGDDEEVADGEHHLSAVASGCGAQRAFHAAEGSADDLNAVASLQVDVAYAIAGQLAGMSVGNGAEAFHVAVGDGHVASLAGVAVMHGEHAQAGDACADVAQAGRGVAHEEVGEEHLALGEHLPAEAVDAHVAGGQEVIHGGQPLLCTAAGEGLELLADGSDALREGEHVPRGFVAADLWRGDGFRVFFGHYRRLITD